MLSWIIVADLRGQDAEYKRRNHSIGVIALLSIISHSVLISCLLLERLDLAICSAGRGSNAVASMISAPMDRSRSKAFDALNHLSLRPQSLLNSFYVLMMPSDLVLSNMVWKRSLFFMQRLSRLEYLR